jgi:hypothetical protein
LVAHEKGLAGWMGEADSATLVGRRIL